MDNYTERIDDLISRIPAAVIDFSKPRERASIPTQVSSEFVTNREQGDWAEDLIVAAVNGASENYVAVKYGKSDKTVAGEAGFSEFFEAYQMELDLIGKRPDLLIFRREDYDSVLGPDISGFDHSLLGDYVKRAVAGIEVRSSAFLYDRYCNDMSEKIARCTEEALSLRDKILTEYAEELNVPTRSRYIDILKSVTADTVNAIDFRVPSWRSDERLIQLSALFRRLKSNLNEIHKRTYLSITPKIEDVKVVYKWIKTFGVPHYYFQVFFDKVYGISFERILEIVTDSKNDGVTYSIEGDVKNQNKQTIKIDAGIGCEIASRVDEPEHFSCRREMNRGRLLFYVRFRGGRACLNAGAFARLLGLPDF